MSLTDPALLNYVIRMVVPLKREFGESLDVQQFMRDTVYSHRILEQARSSQDQRLRDYAGYIGRHVHGARDVSPAPAAPTAGPAGTQHVKSPQSEALARMPPNRAPSAPPAPVAAPRSAPAAAPAVGGEPTADELRARMLKKYTSGLR